MKVFISWSGDLSQATATILKKFLPIIVPGVEPFVSSHDIGSGKRWAFELTTELDATNYGIICLSPSNLRAPWILFEAGALSKFQDSALCSLLIGDLSPTDVSSPLSQFQNRRFERNDFRKLINDIHAKLERPLEPEQFGLLFDAFWPQIESEYRNAVTTFSTSEKSHAKKRDDRELLEEILLRLRGLERLGTAGIAFTQMPPEQLLDLPISYDSLRTYTEWKFPGLGISEHWQSALLRDITSARYPALRHIDDAVNRAMTAIRAYEAEAPELFRTGTDFITKALGFVDSEFRQHHNFAQKTLDAFNKYSHLITA